MIRNFSVLKSLKQGIVEFFVPFSYNNSEDMMTYFEKDMFRIFDLQNLSNIQFSVLTIFEVIQTLLFIQKGLTLKQCTTCN